MSISGATPPPADLQARLTRWSDQLGAARILEDTGRPGDSRLVVDAAQREILAYTKDLRATRADLRRHRALTPTGSMPLMPALPGRQVDLLQDMQGVKLPPLREKTYRFVTPPQAVILLMAAVALLAVVSL